MLFWTNQSQGTSTIVGVYPCPDPSVQQNRVIQMYWKKIQNELASSSTFSIGRGQPKVEGIVGTPPVLWGTILYGVLDEPVY